MQNKQKISDLCPNMLNMYREGGIRTHELIAVHRISTAVLETAPISHSGTSLRKTTLTLFTSS